MLISHVKANMLLGDKVYDERDRILMPLKKLVERPLYHSRKDREYTIHMIHVYRARHLVESFFVKLKQCRSIATRYDKLSQNFTLQQHLSGLIDDTP